MTKSTHTKHNPGKPKTVAMIVAHPDDESLWAGGTIFLNPTWQLFIVSLCRSSDSERAFNFYNALTVLKAEGIMGDIDDGPEQMALNEDDVKNTIINLLPEKNYDLIITHNPSGEYTRHIRHEEVSRAVINLWDEEKIFTKELWTFAYKDGHKQYFPKPDERAPIYQSLTELIWIKKYKLITETYGFGKDSWEAKTTTKTESFWKFTNSNDAQKWLNDGGVLE